MTSVFWPTRGTEGGGGCKRGPPMLPHTKTEESESRSIKHWRENHDIYIHAFGRSFYPKRPEVHSSYIFSLVAFLGNRSHDLGVASIAHDSRATRAHKQWNEEMLMEVTLDFLLKNLSVFVWGSISLSVSLTLTGLWVTATRCAEVHSFLFNHQNTLESSCSSGVWKPASLIFRCVKTHMQTNTR